MRFQQLHRRSALLGLFGLAACTGLRAAVSLKMTPHNRTPLDASASVDETFVGLLGHVAARGIRLPEGAHRITIEREGYFPYDQLVISDREPIHLRVRLIPIPD